MCHKSPAWFYFCALWVFDGQIRAEKQVNTRPHLSTTLSFPPSSRIVIPSVDQQGETFSHCHQLSFSRTGRLQTPNMTPDSALKSHVSCVTTSPISHLGSASYAFIRTHLTCFFLILISCYCECDDTRVLLACTHWYGKPIRPKTVCVCVSVLHVCFVITIEWFVHINIVTSFWMCLLLVGLTLFMRDNTVWIELMHFALKYYSIWIWLKERVSGRVNVLWTLWMIKKKKTAQVILSLNVFILFL